MTLGGSGVSGFGTENAALIMAMIPGYKCPSSSAEAFSRSSDPEIANGFGGTAEVAMTMDYIGITGAYGSAPFNEKAGANYNGGYWTNNGLMLIADSARMRDCTDGTSNTIIIGEDSGFIARKDYRGNYLGGWTGTNSINSFGTGVRTVRYNPNPKAVPTGGDTPYNPNTPLTSFHVGGIHVTVADGSVRFISENVDIETFRRLAMKNDGLVLGEW